MIKKGFVRDFLGTWISLNDIKQFFIMEDDDNKDIYLVGYYNVDNIHPEDRPDDFGQLSEIFSTREQAQDYLDKMFMED